MAQTTGGVSFRNATLEYSTDNSAWTDISGVANKIEQARKTRNSGSAHTATGDTPIVTIGKREAQEVDISIVYSEVTTESLAVLDAAHDAATPCYLRWTAKGTATGNFRYTTGAGYITEIDTPGGEVGAGDPVLVSFKHFSPSVTRAAIA